MLISATYSFKLHRVGLLNSTKCKFLLLQSLWNRLFSLLRKHLQPAFPYICPAIYYLLAGFNLKIFSSLKFVEKIRRAEIDNLLKFQLLAPKYSVTLASVLTSLHFGLLICKIDNEVWIPKAHRAVLVQHKCSVNISNYCVALLALCPFSTVALKVYKRRDHDCLLNTLSLGSETYKILNYCW